MIAAVVFHAYKYTIARPMCLEKLNVIKYSCGRVRNFYAIIIKENEYKVGIRVPLFVKKISFFCKMTLQTWENFLHYCKKVSQVKPK